MSSLIELCGHTFYLPALGSDSVVLDLGASTAAFSTGVNALSGCLCYCVEAAPRNFKAIEETGQINKYFAAMGNSNKDVIFHIVDDEYHWGSLTPPAEFDVVECEKVPGKTLENLIYELKLERIDLLKVDIEGAEIDMFDAASDTTLRKLLQITVEFHDFINPRERDDVRRQIHRFEKLGFDCVVMTHRHHGDVWMVNRKALGLSVLKFLYFKMIIKYTRGIGRILCRFFNEVKGSKV